MKAMILAAGRGERMRPLTDTIPKPLLKIGDLTLIEYHLLNLAQNGITSVIINLSYLGDQIKNALGNGSAYGLAITYIDEGEEALETGGAIHNALPALGNEPFIVINADIWCDYPLRPLQLAADALAHLILVDNPPQHRQGDFFLDGGKLNMQQGVRLTFSGIGYYRPELFNECKPGKFPLAPLLHKGISHERISGSHYAGQWFDVGTPERLQTVQETIKMHEASAS